MVLAAAAFVVFRGKGGDYVDDDDGATVRASDNALGTKVKAAMRKNSKRIGGGANSVVYKVSLAGVIAFASEVAFVSEVAFGG